MRVLSFWPEFHTTGMLNWWKLKLPRFLTLENSGKIYELFCCFCFSLIWLLLTVWPRAKRARRKAKNFLLCGLGRHFGTFEKTNCEIQGIPNVLNNLAFNGIAHCNILEVNGRVIESNFCWDLSISGLSQAPRTFSLL